MAEKTKTKHNPFAWVKKHKKLTALLAVLLAVGIAIAGVRGKARQAGGTPYQYVRTTVLSKTTLSDSVSVNGTVKSGSSASVTAREGEYSSFRNINSSAASTPSTSDATVHQKNSAVVTLAAL